MGQEQTLKLEAQNMKFSLCNGVLDIGELEFKPNTLNNNQLKLSNLKGLRKKIKKLR